MYQYFQIKFFDFSNDNATINTHFLYLFYLQDHISFFKHSILLNLSESINIIRFYISLYLIIYEMINLLLNHQFIIIYFEFHQYILLSFIIN